MKGGAFKKYTSSNFLGVLRDQNVVNMMGKGTQQPIQADIYTMGQYYKESEAGH